MRGVVLDAGSVVHERVVHDREGFALGDEGDDVRGEVFGSVGALGDVRGDPRGDRADGVGAARDGDAHGVRDEY